MYSQYRTLGENSRKRVIIKNWPISGQYHAQTYLYAFYVHFISIWNHFMAIKCLETIHSCPEIKKTGQSKIYFKLQKIPKIRHFRSKITLFWHLTLQSKNRPKIINDQCFGILSSSSITYSKGIKSPLTQKMHVHYLCNCLEFPKEFRRRNLNLPKKRRAR